MLIQVSKNILGKRMCGVIRMIRGVGVEFRKSNFQTGWGKTETETETEKPTKRNANRLQMANLTNYLANFIT